MSFDIDEKEFYETFAEITGDRGLEEAKRWAWSALNWTQQELRNEAEKNKVDGEVFNMGRSEGQANIAASLSLILDPEDKNHWNIIGLLKEVVRLTGERAAVVAYLRQPSEHPDPTRIITMRADEWARRVNADADFIESGGHRPEEEL